MSAYQGTKLFMYPLIEYFAVLQRYSVEPLAAGPHARGAKTPAPSCGVEPAFRRFHAAAKRTCHRVVYLAPSVTRPNAHVAMACGLQPRRCDPAGIQLLVYVSSTFSHEAEPPRPRSYRPDELCRFAASWNLCARLSTTIRARAPKTLSLR